MALTKSTVLMNAKYYFERSRSKKTSEANNAESTEDGQSHILSGTFDGSEFIAKLATTHCATMFPTNAIPTTTNIQPKHEAITTTKHSIMPAKTRAHSTGTFASQSKQRRRRSLSKNEHN
jgi:hypothetical protein